MGGHQQLENFTIAVAMRRYFDVCLYLLIFTGFGTLASTGHLDLPTVLIVTCALLLRGYMLVRRLRVLLSERWTNLLTIGCLSFYIADAFLISRTFLNATVHLVLFVMLVRLFSAQHDRDHYLLAILSFLMVLAAAVLTVDSTFLLALAGFVLVAIPTFILMEMTHASKKARVQARDPQVPVAYRHLSFAIAGIAPLLLVLIFAAAALLFFLLPRVSTGYLGVRSRGTDLSTGFSDHVELGRIGEIQQSQAVVMHVKIDKRVQGGYPLKLRGVSLNDFDGRFWKNTASKTPLIARDGHFALRSQLREPRPERTIHYRVTLEPIMGDVFFLLATPRAVTGKYRAISEDDASNVFDMDPEHPVAEYEAESTVHLRGMPGSAPPSAVYPRPILAPYLQLPVLDPRVAALARQITIKAGTPLERASVMENYLRLHYAYALQMSSAVPRDPIADFLFVRRRGHCEYFASAMALMLRSIGIASRVVNGFAASEFNPVSSRYVVRASDAHSWVEAYIPGEGWTEFDPTPSAIGVHDQWSRVMLYLDAVASFWRDWVVNYDVAHQLRLTEDASRGSRELVVRAQFWARSRFKRMLAWAGRTEDRLRESGVRMGVWTLGGFVLALILFSLPHGMALVRNIRLTRRPQAAPQLAATIWYQKMLRQAARQGWRKAPAQTPAEFVSAIADSELRSQISAFIMHYEKARFGGSAEEALELPRIYQEISNSRSAAYKP